MICRKKNWNPYIAGNDSTPKTGKTAPRIVVFENKELPTILSAMAEHYHVEVVYTNQAAKSIRLYFE